MFLVLQKYRGGALALLFSLVSVWAVHAQTRTQPIPLPGDEIKGTIKPGLRSETYYAAEAGPGSVEFSLSVTTYQDYSLLEVEVLDANYGTLLKFDASSGGDKRDAKLRLDYKQTIFIKLNAPSANKSGAFNLKVRGPISPLRFTAPTTAQSAPPQNQPAAAPVENWSELLKQQQANEPRNPSGRTANAEAPAGNTAPRETSKAVETVAAVTSAAIKEIGADKRIALVIGNGAYEHLPLKNPVNDARAMADALAQCGFEVTMLENANKRRMEEAIRAFGAKLTPTSAGLFYYAGHGLQVNGTNYLVPLAAKIEKESDIEYETVDAGRVLAEFANAQAALSVIILDACRDNPFAAATRSLTRGLAVVKLPKDASGTLVAYATSPGNVARDGTGKNGLYTEELLRNMLTPGLKLEDVFKLTRINVKQRSNNAQVPWENSSIDGDFYFVRKTKK